MMAPLRNQTSTSRRARGMSRLGRDPARMSLIYIGLGHKAFRSPQLWGGRTNVRPDRLMLQLGLADATREFAQGKPVARRGRKARGLTQREMAQPPNSCKPWRLSR